MKRGRGEMYKVLVTSRSFGKYSKEPIAYLEKHNCEVIFTDKSHLRGDELAALIKGYDALIVGIDEVDKQVIEASDRLKVICMHGTGIDHIDVNEASKKGIYVANAPGGNTNAVAELAVGLMFSAARHISHADRSIRPMHWHRPSGIEISGKTLGLVGCGNIGKRVIELLSGFNMHYLVFDKEKDDEFARKNNVRYVSLDELLIESDIVSIHLPLNEQTKGMIAEREIDLMKPHAILINTARGAIIKESDLAAALQEKKILGAALDAFEHEPLEEESPLRYLDNIIFTPHMGATTNESVSNVDLINAKTIVGVLKQNALLNIVNV
jgi:D-3-phosphoglycerate dehydrogenase